MWGSIMCNETEHTTEKYNVTPCNTLPVLNQNVHQWVLSIDSSTTGYSPKCVAAKYVAIYVTAKYINYSLFVHINNHSNTVNLFHFFLLRLIKFRSLHDSCICPSPKSLVLLILSHNLLTKILSIKSLMLQYI